MTDTVNPTAVAKKTPADVSAFEREQLTFLLSAGDVAATLAEMNPSLAWLPLFLEMNLVQSENQLFAWIERNFAEPDAVREVVANVQFFGPQTGNFLEFRLNAQAASLPPLLVKCWTLIIRQMRAAKQGFLGSEWFEIQPQLKRGDYSPAVVQRLAKLLCPKLKIGKRVFWTAADERTVERPSDLMSIDYEVEDYSSSDDVLAAWPADVTAEIDEALLGQLTTALETALADAIDVGVESNEGFSTSDSDVPSVAAHPQNEHRSGFQLIIRVMAEVWTRLKAKSLDRAIAIAERWRDSPFRLTRRLALFSFTNVAVAVELGADMLIALSSGELFLTHSSVEVYRLIRARWNDFPAAKQRRILARLREGPPRSWFREGADIEQHIDRARFDILSDMARDGLDIGPEGRELLADIHARRPQWEPVPPEQAGFHIWSDGGPMAPETDKLKDVADTELLNETRRIAAEAGFMVGDSWRGLCVSDPDRALRGLEAAAGNGDWSPVHWEQLLWSGSGCADPATESKIAELLLQWPADSFSRIAVAASSWLEAHTKALPDDLVWPLWDRIAGATLIESSEIAHD